MATALGMYEDCISKAARCRRLAVRAARLGHRERAMALTAGALKYDDAADGWRPVVPQWQWDLHLSEEG